MSEPATEGHVEEKNVPTNSQAVHWAIKDFGDFENADNRHVSDTKTALIW